ncbi:hypothetical protein GCM10010497_53060 [Streptomyces cinereoruber]|uniref:Uncharacterized protein n=1 Tax=Streptomyces cinereoruber TaxID=67260 RepID=A0AAV4KS13_9ACTN|nr:hypothetical protein GCM10010497_53060 [Streptomyces cinereoruber]
MSGAARRWGAGPASRSRDPGPRKTVVARPVRVPTLTSRRTVRCRRQTFVRGEKTVRSHAAVAVSSSRARYDVILASRSERWRLRARHRRP